MKSDDARGSIIGLLAYLGLGYWLLFLLGSTMGLGVLLAGFWTTMPYALAFGIGLCQLLVVMWGQGRVLRPARRRRALECPPEKVSGTFSGRKRFLTPFRRRGGWALLSVLVSLLILVAGLTLMLQTYLAGARMSRMIADRTAATLALEAHLETLRAHGYAALPPLGRHPLPPAALPDLPEAQGTLAVEPGPAPNTRQVTGVVTWDDRGQRREQLVMVMTGEGMRR